MHQLLTCLLFMTSLLTSSVVGGQTLALNRQSMAFGQSTTPQSLGQLLPQLASRYQVSILADAQLLEGKTVAEWPSGKLETVLRIILKPHGLTFDKIDERTYVIVAKSSGRRLPVSPSPTNTPVHIPVETAPLRQEGNAFSAEPVRQQPQERTLTGRVTDETLGQALPGVSVVLKGTSRGTTTDSEGNYRIAVPEGGGTLVFSYIGYLTQEIAIGARSTLNVTLSADTRSLNEVVVVGYGTQKKSDVTGSVATITAEKLKNQPVQSVDQALAGQLPGVQIIQPTGAPGGGARVRIRGVGSISSGNEPLYVIDGFPIQGSFDQNYNPLTTINPQDIESINVLKDASSTAIYGSRGSNGVVIITTKRGKAGKTRVDVDVYHGVQTIERTIKMMNASQLADASIEARNIFYRDVFGGNPTDPNEVRTTKTSSGFALIPPIFTQPSQYNTDWQDAFYRTAPISNYQVGVSGGSERTTFNVTGGFFRQEGIIPNTNMLRYSTRANVDSRIGEKFRLSISLSPSVKTQKVVDIEGHPCCGGTVLGALTFLPQLPVQYEDGAYSTMTNLTFGFQVPENPLVLTRNENRNQLEYRLLGTVSGEYALTNDLSAKITVGGDLSASREDRFRASTLGNPNQPAPTVPSGFSNSGMNYSWLSEYTLNYNRTAGQHTISAVGGYTVQKARFNSTFLSAINFPNDLVPTLNAGQINGGGTGLSEWALLSYLARVNYSYRDRYLFTASIRRDGSSRFGSNNRWGNFPSVAVGWRISEEPFMKSAQSISELKLRASYGQNGNNFISNYGSIGLVGTANYILGAGVGALANGLVPGTISNPDLTWEKADQVDVGLELGLLNNRIYLTAEYYNRITSGLLLNVQIPSISGFTNTLQNIGKVQNNGVELSLSSRNFTGRSFGWNTDVNISFNRNKVKALGPKGDPIRSSTDVADTHITQLGAPISNFYGYQVSGIFQNQSEVDRGPAWAAPVITKPGDFRFQDINKDGKIDANDRTIIGSPFPKYTFGLTNTFTYKGLDLSILLQGTQGNQVLFLQRRFFGSVGGSNAYASLENRWRSEAQPGDGKTPKAYLTGNSNQVTSYFIEDGSFVRVRNVSLGYRLPSTLTNKLKMQNLRVYVSGQNLYTFTKYAGYNPEVSRNFGGNPLTEGIDYGAYPLARTITVGLNASF